MGYKGSVLQIYYHYHLHGVLCSRIVRTDSQTVCILYFFHSSFLR